MLALHHVVRVAQGPALPPVRCPHLQAPDAADFKKDWDGIEQPPTRPLVIGPCPSSAQAPAPTHPPPSGVGPRTSSQVLQHWPTVSSAP